MHTVICSRTTEFGRCVQAIHELVCTLKIFLKSHKNCNEKKCSDVEILWNSYSGTAIPEHHSVKL